MYSFAAEHPSKPMSKKRLNSTESKSGQPKAKSTKTTTGNGSKKKQPDNRDKHACPECDILVFKVPRHLRLKHEWSPKSSRLWR